MTKLTNLGVHNVAGVTGRSYNLPCWRLSGLTILLGTSVGSILIIKKGFQTLFACGRPFKGEEAGRVGARDRA